MHTRTIDRKEFLPLNIEDRLSLFCKSLNISVKESETALNTHNKKERILNSAELIYCKARALGYDKSQSLAHITSGILGIFLGKHEDLIQSENELSTQIHHYFRSDRDHFQEQFQVNINVPESLRINVFQKAEDKDILLNSQKACKVYGNNVNFSYIDLIRGVKVPTAVGFDESVYLGMLYAGAKLEKSKNSIRFYGSEKEEDLFKIVNRYFHRNLFNISSRNGNNNHPAQKQRKVSTSINSQAVFTWLKYCTGMADSIRERRLPRKGKAITVFDYDKLQMAEPLNILNHGFFYGFLARKARLRKIKSGYNIDINLRRGMPLLEDMKIFSNMLGYGPEIYQKQCRLRYSRQDFIRLSTANLLNFKKFPYDALGGLFNPEHIRAITAS